MRSLDICIANKRPVDLVARWSRRSPYLTSLFFGKGGLEACGGGRRSYVELRTKILSWTSGDPWKAQGKCPVGALRVVEGRRSIIPLFARLLQALLPKRQDANHHCISDAAQIKSLIIQGDAGHVT